MVTILALLPFTAFDISESLNHYCILLYTAKNPLCFFCLLVCAVLYMRSLPETISQDSILNVFPPRWYDPSPNSIYYICILVNFKFELLDCTSILRIGSIYISNFHNLTSTFMQKSLLFYIILAGIILFPLRQPHPSQLLHHLQPLIKSFGKF